MKGLSDYLLDPRRDGLNRYGLTRASEIPFGRSGLYSLRRSKGSESALRRPPENQPAAIQPQPATQGMMRNQDGGNGVGNILNSGLQLASTIKNRSIPGQQPGTPFNMASVNAPEAGREGMQFDADKFARMAGAFGAAIAPKDSWQSRLGVTASQLASENIKKREQAPDVALKRRKTEAEIKKLEEPETVEWKSVDPKTGQEITHYGKKSERPSETISGLAEDTRTTKQKEYDFYAGLDTDQKAMWEKLNLKAGKSDKSTKQKEWEFRASLNPEQRTEWDKLYGKAWSQGSKFSYADKKQYEYLIGRLEALDEQLQPDDYGDVPDEQQQQRIMDERDVILQGLEAIESKVYGGGGMVRGEPGAGSPVNTKTDMQNALNTVLEAGASRSDIEAFVKKNPHASVQQFLNHFKPSGMQKTTPVGTGQAVAAEIPDVKNESVGSPQAQSSSGLQRQSVPYNTSMTTPNTPEQESAAVQELTDLANKLGVGPGNWKALGELAKDIGGWAWESYQNAFNALTGGLIRGQKKARKQLPAYGG